MGRTTRKLASLVGLAVSAVATSCGADAPTTTEFADAGAHVHFTYPASFVNGFSNVGSEVDGRPPSFKTAVGVDATNVVLVETYPLRKSFETYGGHEQFRPFVDSAARTIARFEGAQITRLVDRKLGAMAGYGYDVVLPDGATHEELTFAFKGTVEYFLRCHWDAAGAKTIPRACAMVRTSFATS